MMQERKEVKDCPYCGEEILAKAIKCKHCLSLLETELTLKTSLDHKPPNISFRFNIKRIILPAIAIVFISVLGILLFTDIDFYISKTDEIAEEFRGNTACNINNRGIATQQGDWIYYVNHAEHNIYKMRSDGSDVVKLNDDFSIYLNVVDNWIYYCVADGEVGIYKIRSDGTERTRITEDGYSLSVIDEWIYYYIGGSGGGIYKMRTDGSELSKLSDDIPVLFLNVDRGWIYYISSRLDEHWSVFKIRIDGTGRSKAISDKAYSLNLSGGWLYYVNHDNDYLYRIHVDGSERALVCEDKAYGINVVEDWIYYNNNDDGGSLYKIRTDGSGRVKLNDDKSESINVIGDWIFYVNWSDEKKLYRIRTDGSERQIVK